MAVKNYYPEKRVEPFFTSPSEMGVLVTHIKAQQVPIEVKRAAYIIVRNESSNGKKIINATNAAGVQSDSGRWVSKWDNHIVATTVQKGNREQYLRGFVVFDNLESSIAFLCERLQSRGLYIGGFAHKYYKKEITDVKTLCEAYYHEWVYGSSSPKPAQSEHNAFASMYRDASNTFHYTSEDTVVINTPKGGNVNIRSGAGTTYDVLGTIASKTVCNVIERGKEWTKVRVKGIEGWIVNDYLR